MLYILLSVIYNSTILALIVLSGTIFLVHVRKRRLELV